jgi:hypothetical protein
MRAADEISTAVLNQNPYRHQRGDDRLQRKKTARDSCASWDV